MLIELDDREKFGPAMLALTEKARTFVRLFVDNPRRSGAALARAAGYSDHKDGAKVRAHELLHSTKVLAAIDEELAKRFQTDAVFGRYVMRQVAGQKNHPQRLKAAQGLTDRGGHAVVTEQRHVVEHRDQSGAALMARLKVLAAKFGLDAAALLGGNLKQIEAIVSHETVPVIEHEGEA